MSPSTLTQKKLDAIEYTIAGRCDTHIAERLGISRRTVWRWKTFDDDYRRALQETRERVIARAADRYQPIVIKAMDIMEDLLDDPSPHTRYKAA